MRGSQKCTLLLFNSPKLNFSLLGAPSGAFDSPQPFIQGFLLFFQPSAQIPLCLSWTTAFNAFLKSSYLASPFASSFLPLCPFDPHPAAGLSTQPASCPDIFPSSSSVVPDVPFFFQLARTEEGPLRLSSLQTVSIICLEMDSPTGSKGRKRKSEKSRAPLA